jgi:hypothetical protein
MFHAKVVGKNQSHILSPITFFPKKNRDIFMIMWKNMVEPDDMPQVAT